MPELPEVETVRRGLARLIVGRQVAGVDAVNPGSFRGDPSALVGRAFIGARRRAKLLLLDLDGEQSLAVHLKMTGQLVWRPCDDADSTPDGQGWGGGHPSDSLIGQLPDRSTRVVLDLDDGSHLFFNDQRKFGWMWLMPRPEADALTTGYGPEPMDADAWPLFSKRVRRHQRAPIKAALLDQQVVAGIGNIYADEALWAARVHPSTQVQMLSDKALRRILTAAADVMELSIDLGGSTARNYVDAEGRRGAYLDFAQVFRREGQPCHRCGTTIVKTRVAGRGTHLCPHCQKAPKLV